MEKENIKIDFVSVKLVKERYDSPRITEPDDVVAAIKEFIGDKDREYLILLCLNVKNEINTISTVSVGSLNSSIVHPREIFKVAILYNSASIILAHNHPSGDLTPSNEDSGITERIRKCGKILGIELLDHIIVGFGNRSFYSFKEHGYI